MFRSLARIFFGPERSPGPQYDRDYVRALTIGPKALRAAIDVLSAAGPTRLEWGDAENSNRGLERSIASAPLSDVEAWPDAAHVLLYAKGASLQFGSGSPAMIYFGNDAGESLALSAYRETAAAARPRLDVRRLRPAAWLAAALILGGASTVAPLLEAPTPLAVVGGLAAVLLAILSVIDAAGEIRGTRHLEPLPHRVKRAALRTSPQKVRRNHDDDPRSPTAPNQESLE